MYDVDVIDNIISIKNNRKLLKWKPSQLFNAVWYKRYRN